MLIRNLKNLQQENGMFSMIKITQTMVKEMKIAQPLNLKPKSLTATGGGSNERVAFKNCAPFTKCIHKR